MKITCVVGTRPEFVKMFPVVAELRRRGESPQIIATGQHDSLLRGTPFDDGMKPDVNLGLPGQENPLIYASDCGHALIDVFSENRPEVIIVQGDTASAYAGATVGKLLGIPVAHVEAGIRSGDLLEPWPEETFRIEIDEIAKWKFCPTQHAMDQLHPQSVGHVHCATSESWRGTKLLGMSKITGNTGIDALYSHTKPVEQSQKVDRVLITLHRRESFGEPLHAIVDGLWAAAARYPTLKFVWPIHPNPRVAEALLPRKISRDARAIRYGQPLNLVIATPMATVHFAQMLATSRAVITDSGGVQEEAAALGVPAVIARTLTDRPESVEAGLARVVGKSEAGILEGLQWALDTRCEPSLCFGDGHAAPRIVSHLLDNQ